MQRKPTFLPILLIAFIITSLLSACSQGTSGSSSFSSTYDLLQVTPTGTQSAVTEEPVVPTFTTTVAIGPAVPIVVEQPTKAVTSIPADTEFSNEKPVAQMNFSKPGPGSKVASPISVSAYAYPGYDNKVTLELLGEDGGLMFSKVLTLQESETGWVYFTEEIPFEITTAAESASLVLTSYDVFGRRIALCNAPLLLMQVGDSVMEVPGFAYLPFYLEQPEIGSIVSGGKLHLDGYAHPFNQNPVIIELINENGVILSTQIIPIHEVAGARYSHFSGDVTYTVNQSTPVRLTIRQTMDHAPYLDLALASFTITLRP
jgi:hypothetical protein